MTGDDRSDPASLAGYEPFPSDRQRAYRKAGYWRDLTFHDVLDRTARQYPERLAVVGPDRELTYGELAARSKRIAAYLAGEIGLSSNERVVLQLPNSVEFLEAFFACSRLGVVPVMVLPRHREAEARHVVGLTDAVAYFVDGGRYEQGFDYVGLVDGLADDFGCLRHRVAVNAGDVPEGWVAFDAMCQDRWWDRHGDLVTDHDVDPASPGVLLLSGGTTGMPKGIPRTYNDYVFQWERMAKVAGVESDWVAFPSVPIGHNASLCCVVGAAIWTGASVAVEPILQPEQLMAFVERVGGSYTLPIPTQIIDILEHPNLEEYDLSSLEVVVSGGQKVPPRVVRESIDRWDVGFCNIFGMAEGPLICTRPDDEVDVQAGTVGRPIAPEADEVQIVDIDREGEVPVGEPGELSVRGPGYFTGYFRNEAENAENFDDDGWFYTEDVLAHRVDGNFEVYGRLKDTIIRGGENIYAPGVEDELLEHPEIANAAVVGMPDNRLGERPCAFIELVEGAGEPTVEELSAFLEERGLAVFKHPERVEIVEELPRTEVGKVEKTTLEDRITRMLKDEDHGSGP